MPNKVILMCANTAWSMYNFRKGLIKNLLEENIKVVILAPSDSSFSALTEMGCCCIDLNVSAKGVNPFTDLLLLFKLVSIYGKIKPNLILHFTIKPNIYGSMAARILKIPSVAITTGLGYIFSKKNIVSLIARLLYKLSFKFPEKVLFLNRDDADLFYKFNLVPKQKISLLDSEGVDVDFFAPREKVSLDTRRRFLLISRMLSDKGIHEFVSAAKQLKLEYPDVVFQLLGPCAVDNPNAIPQTVIEEWHDSGLIEYLGVTDDVRSFISDADCIVLPSYYREGVPRTLMEAASMGKPIITTDNVGCREVVLPGQSGYLCQCQNASSLAECFIKFLSLDKYEIDSFGLRARDYMVSRFNEKLTIFFYQKLFSELGFHDFD